MFKISGIAESFRKQGLEKAFSAIVPKVRYNWNTDTIESFQQFFLNMLKYGNFLQKVSKNSNDYKWGDQKEENDHGILWFCKIIHNRLTKKCLPLHRRKNYSLEVELKLHFTRGKRTFHEKCSANWQSSGFLALSDEMSKSSCHVEHEIKKCDCVFGSEWPHMNF